MPVVALSERLCRLVSMPAEGKADILDAPRRWPLMIHSGHRPYLRYHARGVLAYMSIRHVTEFQVERLPQKSS